ncbi:hypothetical protein [Streptomyces platensis]|uniref:hypothetical protein n=1 Tax=Streptomyces platensis TaxID=58346 RepID=UPI00378D693D
MNPLTPTGSFRGGISEERRIRTCRAAVVEDGRLETEESAPEEAEDNIVRGED